MSYLTYIFPVLAAFFVIMVARRWMPAFADSRLPADPETGRAAKPRFGFESREGRLVKLDALLCLIITVCYAVAAFMHYFYENSIDWARAGSIVASKALAFSRSLKAFTASAVASLASLRGSR